MDSDNKYSKWVMTVGEIKTNRLPERKELVILLKKISSRWCFQEEKATSRHYQCCFETTIRQRKQTILNLIKKSSINENNSEHFIDMFTLEPMRGSWEQAVAYCSKEESRIGEVYSSEHKYSGKDIKILDNINTRFPWQQDLIEKLLNQDETSFKDPDDRTIYWICDTEGCSGKSKLVKWFASNFNDICKVSFGSSSQMRTALINIGPKLCYFIDMPRTLGTDEDVDSVLSTLEELKNGFLVSVMFGKYQSLIFDPPHIVVFSNQRCPFAKMSKDRWSSLIIQDKNFVQYERHPAIID